MQSRKPRSDQTEVSRSRFVGLVCSRLQYRWLGNPDVVSDVIADLFGARQTEREQLVSDIVVAHRSCKLRESADLQSLVRRHTSVRALFQGRKKISLASELVPKPGSPQPYRWPVPQLATEGELADCLRLPSTATLDWLTLPHRRRKTAVDHFHRHSNRKRDGTIRWIEQPRPVLMRVQRMIARQVVNNIPLHDSAQGFRLRHSIATCAEPHIGTEVVLRMDLSDFFGSISSARVRTLFAIAGYPSRVATTFAWLCTAQPVPDIGLCRTRLPQGAPTSPALANAIAFRLDRRLHGLSRLLGVTYTRYADDLIFSGNGKFARRTQRFVTSAAAIAMDEGFQINFRKTRVMRRGHQQRVLGLSVNQRLNTPRIEYETLRAILHNCVRFGPDTQNRRQHPRFRESLQGRIAHVANIHTARGEKLHKLFLAIRWPNPNEIDR